MFPVDGRQETMFLVSKSLHANTQLAESMKCRAAHTAGVRSGRHLIGRSASPGRIVCRGSNFDSGKTPPPHTAAHRLVRQQLNFRTRTSLLGADNSVFLPSSGHFNADPRVEQVCCSDAYE